VKLVIPYALLARDNERIGGMIRGRLLLSKKYRQKKEMACAAAKTQHKDGPIEGPVRLQGVAYWPDRRRRDLLFFAKALHDALEGVCYVDDSQIAEVSYRVGGIDRDNPRVELAIESIKG
jgi:Holliday junction resolvase RusA-like endonuclease